MLVVHALHVDSEAFWRAWEKEQVQPEPEWLNCALDLFLSLVERYKSFKSNVVVVDEFRLYLPRVAAVLKSFRSSSSISYLVPGSTSHSSCSTIQQYTLYTTSMLVLLLYTCSYCGSLIRYLPHSLLCIRFALGIYCPLLLVPAGAAARYSSKEYDQLVLLL